MTNGQQLDSFHTTLWRDVQSGDEYRYRMAFVAGLNHHCDDECSQCAAVFCPGHHPLHFHHDGCPACLEMDGAHPEPEVTQ